MTDKLISFPAWPRDDFDELEAVQRALPKEIERRQQLAEKDKHVYPEQNRRMQAHGS